MSVLGIAAALGSLFLLFLSALFIVQIIKIFIPTKAYVPGFLFGLFTMLTTVGAGYTVSFAITALLGSISLPILFGILGGLAVYEYFAVGFAEKLVDSSAAS